MAMYMVHIATIITMMKKATVVVVAVMVTIMNMVTEVVAVVVMDMVTAMVAAVAVVTVTNIRASITNIKNAALCRIFLFLEIYFLSKSSFFAWIHLPFFLSIY